METKKQKSSDEPVEIYTEGYTDPDEEPLPDDIELYMEGGEDEFFFTEDDTYEVEETLNDVTPPIPARSTGNNADGLSRRNTKDISHDNNDLAVHVHEVKVEISETCSFAAENEGYIHDMPEEESSTHPIHDEYDDFNGIINGDGSQSSSDEHGPMSSAPYASYSGNPNEANISQTSGILQEKQYSDHYNSMPNALDSWKEPLTAVKTLVADNDETDTKEDDN